MPQLKMPAPEGMSEEMTKIKLTLKDCGLHLPRKEEKTFWAKAAQSFKWRAAPQPGFGEVQDLQMIEIKEGGAVEQHGKPPKHFVTRKKTSTWLGSETSYVLLSDANSL